MEPDALVAAEPMDDKGFNMGTDPEGVLVIKKTGRIRAPHDIIHDPDPHDHKGQARAIGKDGDRETSSFELRPGMSDSSVVLINRMADLITKMHKHYHPSGIHYKAGAFWAPEPLGGHAHLSWPHNPYGGGSLMAKGYADRVWQVCEVLKAWGDASDFLMPHLFDTVQIKERIAWADKEGRDFARRASIRPSNIEQVMKTGHVEYRYPPSWLDCPESAYCFLGGFELLVREVFDSQVGRRRDWPAFVSRMYTEPGFYPPGGPNLSEAFKVAKEYVAAEDFVSNWVG